jgi:aspartyl-tRNA(Asn)/glutamyl-tRNA(Gln) amidotransferase subunit C
METDGNSPMSDQISPEMFSHLVNLAALEMAADQSEYVRGELNNQLKAIRELEAIPLDSNVPISSHGVPYTPEISQGMRADEWHPYEDPGRILEQAPETADRYIVVPDIPHTTLE